MSVRDKIEGLTRHGIDFDQGGAHITVRDRDGQYLSRSEVLAAVEEWEREQKGGGAHEPGRTNPVRGDVTAPSVGQVWGVQESADEFRPGLPQWQDVCRELGARMAKQERPTDEEKALLDDLCELHTLTRAVQSKQKQIVIPACVAVRLPIEGGAEPNYPAGAYERYREHWLRHETAKHVSVSYFLDDSEILAAIDAAGDQICAAKGTT